jgi:aminopeptidase N
MKNDIRRTFGKTPKMLDLFSNLTGVEYPYAKYAQCVVPLFAAGGMENITATTLSERAPFDERAALDHDEEGLISHELAHQWFGDMVTCKSWQHVWLNEGFATFMAHVWDEHERGRDDYLYSMAHTLRGVAEGDSVDLSSGVVFPFYESPNETFFRHASNPYGKGCAVIHMLRQSLGDDLFWRCIGEYLKRYAWKTAETDDLRKVVDELSGRSYERFFHQWLYRPGCPRIGVSYEWNEGAREARVNFEQTQKISKESPVFSADINVWLVFPDGKITKHIVRMDSRAAALTVPCAKEPVQICVDPNPALLAVFEMNLPEPMLLRQLKEGPTIAARVHAMRAFQDKDSADVRAVLRSILVDESVHNGLRRDAAAALGRMRREPCRDILLESLADGKAIKDHKVRAAAVSALGSYKHPLVAATLLRFAAKDLTYTKKPSYQDQIRTSALSSLAALEEPRGLEPALALAAYGQPASSRPAAIAALGQLGKIESARTKVRTFLIDLLNDPQPRAQRAAISALAELADPKSLPALQAYADSSAPRDRRQSAKNAIDTINKKAGESSIISDLRSRMEKLEKYREESEKRAAKSKAETKGDTTPAKP